MGEYVPRMVRELLVSEDHDLHGMLCALSSGIWERRAKATS
jgi:hypothetical protein